MDSGLGVLRSRDREGGGVDGGAGGWVDDVGGIFGEVPIKIRVRRTVV